MLATNVAETSLTVPGIRYVVDTGTARISRYSRGPRCSGCRSSRSRQASADQRKGRCGRVADGICIRLYAEEDFDARPEFTDPEILRTNLASVILQMTALGLGDVGRVPVRGPARPPRRSATASRCCRSCGALEPGQGGPRGSRRSAASWPSCRSTRGWAGWCSRPTGTAALREVLVIAAALSHPGPARAAGRAAGGGRRSRTRRFADEHSDFLTLAQPLELPARAAGGAVRQRVPPDVPDEFLHYLRDPRVAGPRTASCARSPRELGITVTPAPGRGRPGRPSHRRCSPACSRTSGLREDTGDAREYLGARGARFAIFPGSALRQAAAALGRWPAELVETSRLWAATVRAIEPEWAEQLAGHLVKRTLQRAALVASAAAVVVATSGSRCTACRSSPRRHGRLRPDRPRAVPRAVHPARAGRGRVAAPGTGSSPTTGELLEEVEELEHRARRRDIVVDDETLFDFYDARVPADVVSGAHFDTWWKKARRHAARPAHLHPGHAAAPSATGRHRGLPRTRGGRASLTLPLTYQFEPGAADDGVTVDVPLAVLNRVRRRTSSTGRCPALRQELVTALIRSLPKQLRRNFVPAPDVARAGAGPAGAGPGAAARGAGPGAAAGVREDVPISAFDWAKVPAHLRVTFKVTDGAKTVAQGKDLEQLQRRLGRTVQDVLSDAAKALERTGLTSLDGRHGAADVARAAA